MNLVHALEYTAQGWVVIPITPGTKRPLVKWKRIDSPDTGRVVRWWTRWPEASIGVLCGPSQLVVIDVDDAAGLDALPGPLPETLTAVTGRDGGLHYVYLDRWKPGRLGNTAGYLYVRNRKVETPGIDSKASGGLFVAPPSLHKSGRRYRWSNDRPPACAPAWLTPRPPIKKRPIQATDQPNAERLRPLVDVLLTAEKGERHNLTFWSACRAGELVAAGAVTETDAVAVLSDAAKKVGLPADECLATVQSGIATGYDSAEVTR